MHGNRRNHYDPYLTTAKHVDTACRCNRSLPFASDLFLSVLPQILILYHCIWIYWCSHRNCDTVCIRRRYFQYKLAGHPQWSRMGTRILWYATYPGSFSCPSRNLPWLKIFYRCNCMGNHFIIFRCYDCLFWKNGHGCLNWLTQGNQKLVFIAMARRFFRLVSVDCCWQLSLQPLFPLQTLSY